MMTTGSVDRGFYEGLGRAIQVHRARLGIDRKHLATQAGVSYPYLSEIENGKKRPSSTALLAIAEALGLRPSELLEEAEALLAEVADVVHRQPSEALGLTGLGDSLPASPAALQPPVAVTRMASTMGAPQARAAAAAGPARRSWFRGRSSGKAETPVDAARHRSRQELISSLLLLAQDLPEDDLGRLVDLARRLRA